MRRRRGDELEVTPPRVEVGRVRVIVDGRVGGAVIVEDELVGREERIAVAAADTLGSRTAATHTHTRRTDSFQTRSARCDLDVSNS